MPYTLDALTAARELLLHLVSSGGIKSAPLALLMQSAAARLFQGKPLLMEELIIARTVVSAVVDQDAEARDAAIAGLCFARLPLFFPDQVTEALQQSLVSMKNMQRALIAKTAPTPCA